MNRLILTFTLLLSSLHLLPAQSLDPALLKSPEEHVAFFDTIFEMHQELLRRSGPVILAHGWESTEHLALRDSIINRNAHLRDVVNRYLDLYGFPAPSPKLVARRKAAHSEQMKKIAEQIKSRMTEEILEDDVARDSLLFSVAAKFHKKDSIIRDIWPTVMLILDTEPNFSKRCENISWLRFEWEEGNLPTQKMLVYLRHTYAAKHGKELDIATGSTERERIYMHARELSGCWGN